MPVEINLAFAVDFLSSVYKLSASDGQRAIGAIEKFRSNPTASGLNLEAMKSDPSLMTIRGSRSIRVALSRRGSTYVALFAGQHDDVYNRLNNGKFIVNDSTKRIEFIEFGQQPPVPSITALDSRVQPLQHWTDGHLSDIGFSFEEVATLRSLDYEEDILELFKQGWAESRVDEVLQLLETTYEQYINRSLLDDQERVRDEHLQRAIARYGAVAGLSPLLGEEEVARIARAPIEQWMLFLHPDQSEVANRTFNGPARVRGSAGTGKTVVLLHRTATLAKRYEETLEQQPILVTTYISNLPAILSTLYRQLPLGPKRGVEFINVDKLARQICVDAGEVPTVSTRSVDAAFASAWTTVVKPGSPIDRAKLSRSYMLEELEKVIKGRDIPDFDTYLEVRRVGRSTQFAGPLRKQTWELLQEWNLQMAQRNTVSFADVVNRAKRIALALPQPMFRSALIDEAQDLSQSGLEFIRALVASRSEDRPDELFIAGDGAQRIYPGGFTLLQAGVDVRGRTTVLHRGYRTTQAIADAANAVAGGIMIEDLDEDFIRGNDPDAALRQGEPVQLCEFPQDQHWSTALAQIVHQVRSSDDGIGLGDIGILTPTNKLSEVVTSSLREAGLPFLSLESYEGSTTDEIKVGTYHRSKGLEFKVVILPGLSEGTAPRTPMPGTPIQEIDDQRRLEISALFVAMMRARDHLVLGYSGQPSPLLESILKSIEIVELPSTNSNSPSS